MRDITLTSFGIKRPDDYFTNDLWLRYIDWLNIQRANRGIDGRIVGFGDFYYGHTINKEFLGAQSYAFINLKPLEYIKELLELESANLAYAKKHYPKGTKYQGLDLNGNRIDTTYTVYSEPRENQYGNIDAGPHWLYVKGKWAEIIKEEFDMTTNEGRLAYAKKHYPVGTKYIPLCVDGSSWDQGYEIVFTPILDLYCSLIEGGRGYIYSNGQWAEIIKEEDKMETQKLTRAGLKEIHSVACSSWKSSLELLGANNPLEDYIELNQDQVDAMFKACTESQLLIVSKHLKQCNIKDLINDIDDIQLKTVSKGLLKVRVGGEFTYKSFTLHADYDWKIQQDTYGFKCLIPTKKK